MLFGLFSRRNIRQLDDHELVELARSLDRFALGELFQRYSPLVMGLCLKYMKNIQVAEDVMMNLFEKLPEKIVKADIHNFKSWLYTVSRNECLMELRKKKPDSGDIEKVEDFMSDQEAGLTAQSLQLEENLNLLERAILELKDEQRICVNLFYIKKKSYQDIVQQTGYDLKKVKSHIQNGKRNLKMILEKDGEFK